MPNIKRLSIFVIIFLLIGFLLMAIPEKGYSQNPGCCIEDNGDCLNIGDVLPSGCIFGSINTDGICTIEGPGGACVDELPPPPPPEPPVNNGCCIDEDGGCLNIGDVIPSECEFGTINSDGICTLEGPGGACVNVLPPPEPPLSTTAVPTLSQWGLIMMAGIMGIIGFMMVIRRRQDTS